MRKVKLNREEREIERALLRGEYLDVSKSEFESIARAIAARKKMPRIRTSIRKGLKAPIKKCMVSKVENKYGKTLKKLAK